MATTASSGSIALARHGMVVGLPTVHTSDSVTLRWQPVQTRVVKRYSDRLICAVAGKEEAAIITQLGPWALDRLQVAPSSASILVALSAESLWPACLAMIENDERSEAESYLKRQFSADAVDHVNIQVQLEQGAAPEARPVHLPIYWAPYQHDGRAFPLFVNGQTGSRDGERPFGLGVVGKAVDAVGDALGGLLRRQ